MNKKRQPGSLKMQQTGSTSFGQKGKDELAVTYGEMLLSGKPTERRKSVHIKNTPRFKPRIKPMFGRKETFENEPLAGNRAFRSTSMVVLLAVSFMLSMCVLVVV